MMRWRTRRCSSTSRFFLRNWWVLTFLALGWVLYLRDLETKKVLLTRLQEKKTSLKREKQVALNENKELLLRKESQDDPEWVELVLREKLGVVERGEIKVIFHADESQ